MTARHGGHVLAEALLERGVTTVFTLCGNHTLAAYEGLIDAGIRLYDMRTEAGAVMAADGYARATRRPAVALVTGGPGHTNALTGLVTAHSSESPVVLISGQTDLALTGRGAQQEMDQVGSALPLCKWSRLVRDVGEIRSLVHQAFETAMAGTTGAVHLSLPADVARAVPPASVETAAPTPSEAPENEAATASMDNAQVNRTHVDSVVRLLAAAARPVLIAGSGAYMGDAGAGLSRLLEVTSLPLFTIDLARGLVPDGQSLGYADPSLSQRARRIRDADVVVLLGKRLDFRLRFGDPSVIAEDCVLVDVHAVGAEVDQNRDRSIAIETDIAAFVDSLANAAAAFDWRPDWREELARIPPQPLPPDLPVEPPASAPFHPLHVARQLQQVIPAEAGIVLDAGDFVQWCRGELLAPGPGRWLRLGPMSTCGAGTPMAIGLACARPDIPVVLLTGDGSFGYYMIEFEAALRHGSPFVAVVGHNSAWGLEYNLQRSLYGEKYVVASELSAVRYDRVTTAMGGYGEHVTSLDELGPAIRRAIASGLPACIEIPVLRSPSPLTEAVVARGGEV